MTIAALTALLAIGALAGCTPGTRHDAGGTASATTAAAVRLPPVTGVFDYQLGGAYEARVAETKYAATQRFTVVVRDATARPLAGAYNICYVNGFQTQPEDSDRWRTRYRNLLLRNGDELVVDPDWPDEYVLDPSTAQRRSAILDIIGPVITGCAAAGFDAVEIDNLDTWTRFPAIDEAGARALAAAYVSLAHRAGLAIAQKNAVEIARTAHRDIGFDFAVTEECGALGECAGYSDVYGRHVLQIEYPDALATANTTFARVCADPDRAPLTILRDRDLVAPGDPHYRYAAC